VVDYDDFEFTAIPRRAGIEANRVATGPRCELEKLDRPQLVGVEVARTGRLMVIRA